MRLLNGDVARRLRGVALSKGVGVEGGLMVVLVVMLVVVLVRADAQPSPLRWGAVHLMVCVVFAAAGHGAAFHSRGEGDVVAAVGGGGEGGAWRLGRL